MALANAYQGLLLQHRIIVDHYEIIGNRVFAFDRKNKKLIVVDHTGPAKQEGCLSLSLVAETQVLKEKNKSGHTEKIFLQIKVKRSGVGCRLCFFDQSHDDIIELSAAARRAMIWKNRIDLHKYPGSVSLGREYVL